jgi:phenylacetate-CoA ligase
VPRARICQVHTSTGTTAKQLGDHAYRLLSWEDIYVSELVTRTHCSPVSPSKPGDVVAMALPYEMSSAGMAMHKTFQYAAQAAVVNVGKGGFYSHPLKTVYAMADLRANIIVTTPSYAVALADAAREAGIDVAEAVRAKLLWLTGEPCSDAFRDRLSRLWGCEALRYYGSLECGGVGAECVYHAGFHISEEHVFVEIVDPRTGRPLPPGMVGEVVMTVLNKTGAPMIRYRTGDLGLFDDDPCRCCLGSPRIFLRGREESQLRLAGGVTCSPVQLEQALFSLPEVGNSYQLVVRDGQLTVRAEVARGIEPTQVLAEKVRCRMACFAGEVEAVELVERIATTGGKAQRVVNL